MRAPIFRRLRIRGTSSSGSNSCPCDDEDCDDGEERDGECCDEEGCNGKGDDEGCDDEGWDDEGCDDDCVCDGRCKHLIRFRSTFICLPLVLSSTTMVRLLAQCLMTVAVSLNATSNLRFFVLGLVSRSGLMQTVEPIGILLVFEAMNTLFQVLSILILEDCQVMNMSISEITLAGNITFFSR